MKYLFTSLLAIGFIFSASSQTQIIGGSNGNGDFENGSTGWTLVNGSQTNKWVVSNGATPGFTGNCIYISSSPSAPYAHKYDTTAAAYSYFYRDIDIPANAKSFWIVFDYISQGEAIPLYTTLNEAKDALRIWGRSTNTLVNAGEELNFTFVDVNVGYYNQNTWKYRQARPLSISGFEGGKMRVIFQWFNDNKNGKQPPVAIDNIEMFWSCQELLTTSVSQASATTCQLVWNTLPTATGYEIRYRKIGEPTTVATYTKPTTIAGGNTYYTTLTNLTPASEYITEIRPLGTSCSEFSCPSNFETLTPPVNDSCSCAIALAVEGVNSKGLVSNFKGATPTSGLSSACGNATDNDVWFKFTATQTKHYIQTKTGDPAYSNYAAKYLQLYEGSCNNLTPVDFPCAPTNYSVPQQGYITRLTATGLKPGTTYYIRAIANDNFTWSDFNITVLTELAAPECAALLSPAQNTIVNYGTPVQFTWRKSADAAGYRVRIIMQSGAYSEYHIRDTSLSQILSPGIRYTWTVEPFNWLDIGSTCAGTAFNTCSPVAASVSIAAQSATTKCAYDPVLLIADKKTNVQWFLNNVAIPGATKDSLYAIPTGTYTARLRTDSCYGDASNSITLSNLFTVVKPELTKGAGNSFCEGGSLLLTAPYNFGNQWFNGANPIAGATGLTYSATSSGNYYVRMTNSSSGCNSYSDTVAVSVTPLPGTPVISSPNGLTACTGYSVKLRSSNLLGNQWYTGGTLISGATDSVFYAKQSGDYTVKTTLNTCSSNLSVSAAVTINALPATPTITPTGSNPFCSGDSLKLSSSAATGNQWFKNNVAVNAATGSILYAKDAGSYTVKTTVNGCGSPASTAIVVTTHPQPAKPTVTVNGYTLSTPAGQASYQWYLNNSPVSGATTQQLTVLTAGSYKVEITDAKGCKISSDAVNATVTGLNEVTVSGYKVSVYPNPTPRMLNIVVAPGNGARRNVSAILTDAYGKEYSKKNLTVGNNTIDLSRFPSSVYWISLREGDTIKSIKVIRQ